MSYSDWPRKLTGWTKVGEAALVIAQIFNTNGPLATTDGNIYALSSCLLWAVILVLLLNLEDPKWWPFYVSWLGALAVETTLLGLSLNYYCPLHPTEIAQTVFKVSHIVFIISLLALYFVTGRTKNWKGKDDEEAAPLLAHSGESQDNENSPNVPSYGSTGVDGSTSSEQDQPDETSDEDKEAKEDEERMKRVKDRLKEKGNWFSYAREFLVSGTVYSSLKVNGGNARALRNPCHIWCIFALSRN